MSYTISIGSFDGSVSPTWGSTSGLGVSVRSVERV